MAVVSTKKGAFTVKAYSGDAKTLLAFNIDEPGAKGLAGFTIQITPAGHPSYYLHNTLQFEKPGDHAQDATEPPNSTINAPIHKMRWVHVPGSVHQGTRPFYGKYTYVVTPRYLEGNRVMLPIDPKLSLSVALDVAPFAKGNLELAFTRGFVQSQAYVNNFGPKAVIRPADKKPFFDTSTVAGTNPSGVKFTYAEEYEWLGSTAREKVFAMLNEVKASNTLLLDVFAYDLNEPDVVELLLQLAAKGKLRIILDNAGLHHNMKAPKAEDAFEVAFNKRKKGKSEIIRSHFTTFAHDKVMIVRRGNNALKVLTGSTNFSVNGMYVNANHVLVFDDAKVAALYLQLFNAAWQGKAKTAAFEKTTLSKQAFSPAGRGTPKFSVTFAPHAAPFAEKLMSDLTRRIQEEGKSKSNSRSVLFAVMDLGSGGGPVRPALISLHADQTIFSYGISDSKKGMSLYLPKRKNGLLVTGKPGATLLPQPFNQVPSVEGHQVHHKFVVCGFNTPNAVVYCGSSNLATGGEERNGDNLLEIHDQDVATAFAIEALLLVDHFEFLDRYVRAKKGTKKAPAAKREAAVEARWFLWPNDKWAQPYFDSKDLRSVDRLLFA